MDIPAWITIDFSWKRYFIGFCFERWNEGIDIGIFFLMFEIRINTDNPKDQEKKLFEFYLREGYFK